MAHNDCGFLAGIKAEIDAERDAGYSVTPKEADDLRKRYPLDTPEGYKRFTPEEFFDGA